MSEQAQQAPAEYRRLRKRYRRDKRFKLYCIGALVLACVFLVYFLGDLIYRGYPAFKQAQVQATFRYTEMSVEIPKLLVEQKTRDLVSRGALRTVPQRLEKNPHGEIKVRVDLENGDPAAPLEAVRPPETVEGVSGAQIARLLGPDGVKEVAAELRGDHEPVTEADQQTPGVRWVWANEAADAYLLARHADDGGAERKADTATLDDSLQSALSRLTDADAARRQFNKLMGTTETRWVATVSEVDQYLQLPETLDEDEIGQHTRLNADQRRRVDALVEAGRIEFAFNDTFFTSGDSALPEQAGIFSAAIGSFFVLVLVFAFSFPVGVLTAIYLEEFAPDNKLTQTIEVNINNLAAIPSILFGLLGLALFINMSKELFEVNIRNTALVGGLTLSLMTLPIIIISARAALRAVPDSIRLGAMAMGATRWQAVCHHVLPQSISGILTGTIIGLAQAIGETAPLIMIGLVAFIPDAANSITDPTTVLPAQIFFWSTNSQRGFVELTAAGILVLLAVLLSMNAIAVILRAKFEKKW